MSADPAPTRRPTPGPRVQPARSERAAATDPAAVLRRRARELARPIADARAEAGAGADYLAFQLGGQTYAVESAAVREAVQPGAITRLPGLPPTLRGLVNVRSRIVPAFDLRPVLNLRPRAESAGAETMLIVVSGHAEFGLLVDELLGMRTVPADRIRTEVAALQARFLRGVAADAVLLLDLGAVARALTVEDRPAS